MLVVLAVAAVAAAALLKVLARLANRPVTLLLSFPGSFPALECKFSFGLETQRQD